MVYINIRSFSLSCVEPVEDHPFLVYFQCPVCLFGLFFPLARAVAGSGYYLGMKSAHVFMDS
ncbi:hypothetical protein FRUB_07557 [Fimbriiglobus ruber]|uniref:Uncharacterized protein n=1 Tax=Fimbriiglobus ruber TaxID=1908690 RepID=A0A225DQI1_9BACT|nr:hypothetical protein FRUB_07557 [Fimbriiglobus ruber]